MKSSRERPSLTLNCSLKYSTIGYDNEHKTRKIVLLSKVSSVKF